MCTIDVHNRDVVGKLISMKAENSQEFAWLSQLRHRWEEKKKECLVNICDAEFKYSNEYLGNTPRLVITPLTDRCYITLTQSLHLTMSGAPAGPAGPALYLSLSLSLSASTYLTLYHCLNFSLSHSISPLTPLFLFLNSFFLHPSLKFFSLHLYLTLCL